MIVLVTGSRHWRDARAVWNALDAAAPTRVIVGDASGADLHARLWGFRHHVPCDVFAAYWKRLGNYAGPERNGRMIAQRPDRVLAFPLPDGSGTQDCIRKARFAGIPVDVFGEE